MRWWRTRSKINFGGEASGSGLDGLTPQRQTINGNENAIEIQGRAREAGRSCDEAFPNRVIDGSAQRAQHDCRRRHVGISVAFPLDGKTLLVNFRPDAG
jgi:hypothetical protein